MTTRARAIRDALIGLLAGVVLTAAASAPALAQAPDTSPACAGAWAARTASCG
jgi:hypothetical protein